MLYTPFISSNNAGRTFFSSTDLGKEGNTLERPLQTGNQHFLFHTVPGETMNPLQALLAVQDLGENLPKEVKRHIKKRAHSYRMNCAFSFGVLAGKASRKRIVEIKMLSK
jgi:hypothetical protein